MTRSELIDKVAESFPGFRYTQIEKVVSGIFEEIVRSVADGYRVEFRGFGAFSIRYTKPRLGRNPKIGEVVTILAKRKAFFKTGKELWRKINSNSKAPGCGI